MMHVGYPGDQGPNKRFNRMRKQRRGEGGYSSA